MTMKFRPISLGVSLAASILVGLSFWYFLETIQADMVTWQSSCCERCANIIYDIDQPIIAFCTGLAFFASTFLAVRGWTVIFKAIAVCWGCFQIYWFMTFWAAIHYRECTAINYPKGLFPILGGISMEIETTVWALACAAIFLIYNQCRKLFVPPEAKASQELNDN
jgi:hypothetical protein